MAPTLNDRIDALEEKVEKPRKDRTAYVAVGIAMFTALVGAAPVVKDLLPSDPPSKVVEISNVSPETGWTYKEYLENTGRPVGQHAAWLNREGLQVTFDVEFVGYKHKPLRATGWIVSAAGQRVREIYGIAGDYNLTPTGSTYKANPDVWLALPAKAGKYKVVAAVYTQNGDARLDTHESPLFSVAGHE
jgi:hypothetical protein